MGDKYGYRKKGKKPNRERERKIKRDPQKKAMRMREKQAASLHPISQKSTENVHFLQKSILAIPILIDYGRKPVQK